ncbi:hypothetical protein, partial [Burkholderia sp. Tr-860]|uniref:hypothetical protein n=1 Tax=Burkholderia sp. Tr-860 TaxID=2608338 RepID=UPI001962A58B
RGLNGPLAAGRRGKDDPAGVSRIISESSMIVVPATIYHAGRFIAWRDSRQPSPMFNRVIARVS